MTAVVAGRVGVADVAPSESTALRRTVAWRGRLGWPAVAVLGPLALFAVAVVTVAAPAVIPRLARTRRSDRPRSDRPRSDRPHIDRPHIDRAGSSP